MIILPYGERALLVNFEQQIDPDINQKVINLHHALTGEPGVTFTIPAYASLTVGFDPAQVTFDELKEIIIDKGSSSKGVNYTANTYLIPVCYDHKMAPDMEEVCQLTGLNEEEIIRLHTSHTYRVFMLGFVAGFAYLGSLPEALQCPRKQSPRKVVPQGAVGLAGFQTGIYPTEAPGGWQLIGQTPVKTFDPAKDEPVVLKPGDQVRFRAIPEAEYDSIQDSVKFGTYDWEVIHA